MRLTARERSGYIGIGHSSVPRRPEKVIESFVAWAAGRNQRPLPIRSYALLKRALRVRERQSLDRMIMVMAALATE